MNKSSRVLKTKGNKITSRFGKRTLTYTSGPAKGKTITKNHNGIDIVGTGSTLDYIVVHTAGTVKSAGFDDACGYYAQIQTATGALMVYYHLAKGTLKVKTGDKVTQGQVIGYMGATGNVTGAHLHFGIKVNGEWIDPEPYINADFDGAGEEVETVTIEVPVIKKGSTGATVETLQQLLNAKGYNCGTADGSFGAKTDAALRKYQKAVGLTADGSCGKNTWTTLLNK